MAQLKDSVVQGSLQVTDTVYTTDLIINGSKTARYVLAAPTSNGAPTFRALTNADVGLGNVENTKLSTWTGSTAVTTLGTISTGTWSASTVSANKGGTGLTSYSVGNMLYASAASTLATVTPNTAAVQKVLSMTGTGTAGAAPTWINKGNGRIFYGTCGTAAATATKTVVCANYDALTAGDIIVVKFTNTNSATASSVTLKIQNASSDPTVTTAEVGVREIDAAIVSMQRAANLAANTPAVFIYNGTYWILISSNNDFQGKWIRYSASTMLTTTTLNPYKLLLQDSPNSFVPACIGTSTGNGKTDITTSSFLIFGDYCYYTSLTDTVDALEAGAAIPNDRMWSQATMSLRYSFNTNTSLTSNKDVYIVATPDTDGIHAKLRNPGNTGSSGYATSSNGPITQTLPSTDNGYIYIRIGRAYSTSQIVLTLSHPVYWYKNGKLRPYTAPYGTVSTVSGNTLSLVDIDSTQVATYTPVVSVPTSTPVLEWNTGVTLATVNSVDIKAALPANPWKVYYSSTTPTGTIAEGSLWFKPM